MSERAQLDGMLDMLEKLWEHTDALYNGMSEEDWNRPHGNHWIIADLPFHLSYFDRETTALPIKYGRNYPNPDGEIKKTIREVNTWNDQKFRNRDPGLTHIDFRNMAEQARQEIRDVTAGLTDANLEDPIFFKIFYFGWSTVAVSLSGCIQHSWNHLIELALHLEKEEPAISSEISHFGLMMYMNFNPAIAYHALKNNTQHLSTNITVEGVGGSTWNITAIEEGGFTLEENLDSKVDLHITFKSLTAFIKNQNSIALIPSLIDSGEATVNSPAAFDTYSEFFQYPPLDVLIELPPR